jgi:hypothetical protein
LQQTVTILQQAIAGAGSAGGNALGAIGRLAENHRHIRFAEPLGSDWRFFATYAGV